MIHSVSNEYDLLIGKLDAFIRKFYLNKIIRGSLLFSAVLLASFLIITTSEYFLYFSPVIRKGLLFIFVVGNLISLFAWVLVPAFHLYRLGKIISYQQASEIIGSYFNNVQDKLLNILQLKSQMENNHENVLAIAGIDQKILTIKPVVFNQAINIRLNKKYLPYALPPLMIMLFILLASPNLITESSLRFLHPATLFTKKAPFDFLIKNKLLQTVQSKDFELIVEVKGESLPEQLILTNGGVEYSMMKTAKNEFQFNFSKPQKSSSFILTGGGFSSHEFYLKVVPKPTILKFKVNIHYPSYIGKPDEIVENVGDLTIPEGTLLKWNFTTQNTSNIAVRFGDSALLAKPTSNNVFQFEKKIKISKPYCVFVSGNGLQNVDSVDYTLTSISDLFPVINVSQLGDSNLYNNIYFVGDVSDDYGLKKLTFNYKIIHADAKLAPEISTNDLSFNSGKHSQFQRAWNVSELNLQPGDEVQYFFEVWDNDGVNGSKSSKSQIKKIIIPSLAELNDKADANNQQLKEQLQDGINKTTDIQKQFDELYKELLQKKNPTWEDKKKLQDLLKQQTEIQNQIEQLKKDYQNNIEQQNQFQKPTNDLDQKQKQLQDLLNKTMSQEMKDLTQKMQQLLDQLNKDKMLNQIDDQKLNSEQLNMDMDRLLSIFKQLEFEQKFHQTIDQLNKLAEKQEELSKESSDKKNNSDSLQMKQEDVNKEFEDIKKQLDQLSKLQDSLDRKNQIPDTESEQKNIDEKLNNSLDQLKKSNNNGASQSEKQASDQMKQLSQSMQDQMSSMESQEAEMDINAIKQLLENLIKASLDQESLIYNVDQTNIYNPRYLDVIKNQYSLNNDIDMIIDSITELSKRVIQIQSFVNDKIKVINKNTTESIKNLESRQTALSKINQQIVMTNLNDLALIFDEILKQLQQQQAQKKAGNQMCQKPGNGKPSLGSINQMQKQLNDQIKQLQDQMKPGSKPSQNGQSGTSEQFAKMAQQQAEIKKMLDAFNKENNPNGQLGDLNDISKQMQEIEKQLINKDLSDATFNRQNEILQKLLSAENAEKTREKDTERKANTSDNFSGNIPMEITDYMKFKSDEFELYKSVPADLNDFYNGLVNKYYKSISK